MDYSQDVSAVSAVTGDDPVMLEMPGGYTFDPNLQRDYGADYSPTAVADDPRVREALTRLQDSVDATRAGGFYGIPWPWVAGGLLAIILLRR